MTTSMALSHAREIVGGCLDLPALVGQIGDTDDLVSSGIDSGEIIRIVQRCEEVLERRLTGDELAGINSISAVAALLGGEREDGV